MTHRSLDRLLFAQGGDCFFCKQPLPREQASVEHLVALVHGGKDHDENCVVCCKALNQLLGRMSLKEKLDVVLRQKGPFVCPARVGSGVSLSGASRQPVSAMRTTSVAQLGVREPEAADALQYVVERLRADPQQRPATLAQLRACVLAWLTGAGWPASSAAAVLRAMRERHYLDVRNARVQAYVLPQGAVHGLEHAPLKKRG